MIIETINLSKTYPGGGGCRDISLDVEPGEVFGLLGPNGAGKSTFVKVLLGLVEASSGTAKILNRPLGDIRVRKEISFLPENFRYHEWMTAWEVMHYHGALYGLPRGEIRERVPGAMQKVGLSGKEGQRISTFSKGMQQRLGLAVALLNKPKLVFLDEPTSALDPIGRRHVRELILELRREGTTVFLNSHLLSEVEMLCDRVVVIKEGRMIAGGRLKELLKKEVKVEIVLGTSHHTLENEAAAHCRKLTISGNRLTATLDKETDIPPLVHSLVKAGAQIYSVTPYKNNLEDLFVKLVAEEAKENV